MTIRERIYDLVFSVGDEGRRKLLLLLIKNLSDDQLEDLWGKIEDCLL